MAKRLVVQLDRASVNDTALVLTCSCLKHLNLSVYPDIIIFWGTDTNQILETDVYTKMLTALLYNKKYSCYI